MSMHPPIHSVHWWPINCIVIKSQASSSTNQFNWSPAWHIIIHAAAVTTNRSTCVYTPYAVIQRRCPQIYIRKYKAQQLKTPRAKRIRPSPRQTQAKCKFRQWMNDCWPHDDDENLTEIVNDINLFIDFHRAELFFCSVCQSVAVIIGRENCKSLPQISIEIILFSAITPPRNVCITTPHTVVVHYLSTSELLCIFRLPLTVYSWITANPPQQCSSLAGSLFHCTRRTYIHTYIQVVEYIIETSTINTVACAKIHLRLSCRCCRRRLRPWCGRYALFAKTLNSTKTTSIRTLKELTSFSHFLSPSLSQSTQLSIFPPFP